MGVFKNIWWFIMVQGKDVEQLLKYDEETLCRSKLPGIGT